MQGRGLGDITIDYAVTSHHGNKGGFDIREVRTDGLGANPLRHSKRSSDVWAITDQFGYHLLGYGPPRWLAVPQRPCQVGM